MRIDIFVLTHLRIRNEISPKMIIGGTHLFSWYTTWGKHATVFGRTTKIYKEELGDLCRLDVECILCPYL